MNSYVLRGIIGAVDFSTTAGETLLGCAINEKPIFIEPILDNPTLSLEQWKRVFEKFLQDYRPIGLQGDMGMFSYGRAKFRRFALTHWDFFSWVPEDFGAQDLLMLIEAAEPLLEHREFLSAAAKQIDYEGVKTCLGYMSLSEKWPWDVSGAEYAERYVQEILKMAGAYWDGQKAGVHKVLTLLEGNASFRSVLSKKRIASLMAMDQNPDQRQRWVRLLGKEHAERTEGRAL